MPEVILREVEDGDLPMLFEQQLDPEANRMAAFTVADPADRDAFMARWRRIRANESGTVRTIVADGEVAGSVRSTGAAPPTTPARGACSRSAASS